MELVVMRGGAFDGEIRTVESSDVGESYLYDPGQWGSARRPDEVYDATSEFDELADGRVARVARLRE